MQEWSVSGWAAVGGIAAVAVLACLLLVVLVRRERARATREAAALRAQLDGIERRLDDQVAARERLAAEVEEREFVITRLGEPEPAADRVPSPPVERVPGPVFADLVLRESVVQAASLAAGVRRALSPEVRQRVRLEMRREVKRARKQRRTEQRAALREWQARQRAGESTA